MTDAMEQAVRVRARFCCEYCRVPESTSEFRFVCDHIIARQHGGQPIPDNLALCCGRCNRHKGPNVAGIDPETYVLTRLFNPRTDAWREHFCWDGAAIAGITPIGRTTVHVLAMNHPSRIVARELLLAAGLLKV